MHSSKKSIYVNIARNVNFGGEYAIILFYCAEVSRFNSLCGVEELIQSGRDDERRECGRCMEKLPRPLDRDRLTYSSQGVRTVAIMTATRYIELRHPHGELPITAIPL